MDSAEIAIRWARGPDDVSDALRVREQVFCQEQGVPLAAEMDSHDDQALHLVAIDPSEQRVIATLRLLTDARGAKIGRVAVERAWRRRGIALRMLALALVEARERGCVTARLAAQMEAIALYRQAGFGIESEPFEEAGIAHVWMGRTLAPKEP